MKSRIGARIFSNKSDFPEISPIGNPIITEINAKITALWILLWASRYFIITDEGKSVSCSQTEKSDDLINMFVVTMRKSKEVALKEDKE